MENLSRDIENQEVKSVDTGDFDDENFEQQIAEIQKDKEEDRKQRESKIVDLVSELNDEDMSRKIDSFVDNIKGDGDIIDFDGFRKIGKGGTHDVFDSDKANDFVMKINRKVLGIIKENTVDGKISDKVSRQIEGFINEKNSKNNELYKSFEVGNCLYENMRFVKIKYNNEVIGCPVVFQEKSDLFSKKKVNNVDFGASYINDMYDIDGYKKINEALLTDKIGELPEKELFTMNSKLPKIFDKIESDPLFAEKLKDFLSRFKDYYTKEGEIIDLVGKDNVLFYSEGGSWNFKLGSVIKNTTREAVNETLLSLEKNSENLTGENLNHLKNILACTRFLNSLGIKLGMGKIINLNLNSTQIENLNNMMI